MINQINPQKIKLKYNIVDLQMWAELKGGHTSIKPSGHNSH